ncbi:MAG TPA: sulfate adenylyltransferase subunit CysN [Caldithrix abyssi]|uniref:sulfate adenylyltransferase n=1 Tax=Caldithrix abyssi TaxID=187145 RepID=A0A7V1LMU9_CALAY|nr:sulfate adenylyltransferase subunit CysN [Caldithrix abyssi]
MDAKTLQNYETSELLRFTTAGSVDDGKSTLIGRLLYDSKAIFEDQMEAIEEASMRSGADEVNLALLTDGLRAEREQGITIDVAYRYFATPKRKFIIADTPGHVQYTRNMVTGASTANAALILIDARHGVIEQTLRHAFIASLLQIPHVVVCVNKMDLVDYSEEVFEEIRTVFMGFAGKLAIKDIHFIPISALKGDNVVNRSTRMEWYQGPTLMYLLEHVYIGSDNNHIDARFPVQYVIRPQSAEYPDYRGYAGRLASGTLRKGDAVVVLPSGFSSHVKSIDFYKDSLDIAYAPQSVTITLEDDIDISRGDMIVRENNRPEISQDIDIMICWLNDKPMRPGGKYALMHTSNEVRCMIRDVKYKIDINTLDRDNEDKNIGMNDIGRISIRTTKPLYFDSYRQNRVTGSLILIDEATNETVCAGMIV